MSGVRVNLLPREAEDRERGRRMMAGLAVAGVVFLAILAGLYFLQNARVDDANDRLAQAEAERARLQEEVDELDRYADLEERHEASVATVSTTMGTEVSIAGILQDVAAVMPNEAALTNLNASLTAGAEGQEAFDFGGPAFGTINGSGETLRGHAPGVERFIIEFDKIAAFFNVFVSSSNIDDLDIATFTFEADLGPEVFTGRYLEGLPEGLR